MPRRTRRGTSPPVDPARLRALFADQSDGDDDGSTQRVPEAVPEARPATGWIPEPPPDADLSWAREVDVLEPLPGERVPAEPGPPPGRHRRGPRVLTLPVSLRGARLTVTWRAVLAVLLLVLASLLVFAVRAVRAVETAAPQAIGPSDLLSRAETPSAFVTGTAPATALDTALTTALATARGSPATSSVAAKVLVVDVIGQVTHPGVVSVPGGARVGDVLAAAGGALPGADVARLNLARLVADGEQVFVPRPGESAPVPVGVVGGSGVDGSGAAGSSGGASPSGPIDLNAATVAQLDTLPGVGPVLAQRILDWRTTHGRFSSVDELGEVSGIGDKLLGQLKPKVRV